MGCQKSGPEQLHIFLLIVFEVLNAKREGTKCGARTHAVKAVNTMSGIQKACQSYVLKQNDCGRLKNNKSSLGILTSL